MYNYVCTVAAEVKLDFSLDIALVSSQSWVLTPKHFILNTTGTKGHVTNVTAAAESSWQMYTTVC